MKSSIIIENVSYGLTVKNGDDYEKCHVEGQVVGGDVHGAINALKDVVGRSLRIDIPMNEFVNTKTDHAAAIIEPIGEAPSKGTVADAVDVVEKAEGTRITRKQKLMTALTKAGIEYNPRWSADKLEALLDDGGEEEAVEEKPAKKESVVKEKVKKAKYQTYDRTIEEHMDMLCDVLDAEWPSWEEHSDLAKKQISMKLKGVEMLDEKGKLLPEFTEAVNERIEVCIAKIAKS